MRTVHFMYITCSLFAKAALYWRSCRMLANYLPLRLFTNPYIFRININATLEVEMWKQMRNQIFCLTDIRTRYCLTDILFNYIDYCNIWILQHLNIATFEYCNFWILQFQLLTIATFENCKLQLLNIATQLLKIAISTLIIATQFWLLHTLTR